HDALEADRRRDPAVDLFDERERRLPPGGFRLRGGLRLRRRGLRLLRRGFARGRLLRRFLAGDHPQSVSFTTSPARTMTGSFLPSEARRLMSLRGSPSTTIRSANAPGFTQPIFPPSIMSSAG